MPYHNTSYKSIITTSNWKPIITTSNWKQLLWMLSDYHEEDHTVSFSNHGGSLSCNCPDWRSSVFAASQRPYGEDRPLRNAVYCPHVVDFHEEHTGEVLLTQLQVFDTDGTFWDDHDWRFEVDDMRDALPFRCLIWRKRGRNGVTVKYDVLHWDVALTPLPETEGTLWNVFYRPDPICRGESAHLVVHPELRQQEDLYHIGFYNVADPLLGIGRLVASQFVDIALAAPCLSCNAVMDPAHLAAPGGRWAGIRRGHFLETHDGNCESCDESELIPVLTEYEKPSRPSWATT